MLKRDCEHFLCNSVQTPTTTTAKATHQCRLETEEDFVRDLFNQWVADKLRVSEALTECSDTTIGQENPTIQRAGRKGGGGGGDDDDDDDNGDLATTTTTTASVSPDAAVLTSWSNGIIIRRLDKGITNRMYAISLDTGLLPKRLRNHFPSNKVALRLYGKGTDAVIDRRRVGMIEDYLAKYALCKQVYKRTEVGQVEEWIMGDTVSDGSQMYLDKTLRNAIARQTAKLHSIHMTSEIQALSDKQGSVVWELIDRCIAATEATPFPSQAVNFSEIKRIYAHIQRHCKAARSPLVLGHGDLLADNIIRAPGTPVFIDYEYAGCMERGFDIANHFCEYAGVECDYDKHFPDKTLQTEFIREYLAHSGVSDEGHVEMLYNEIQPFFGASHLLWALFGLYQSTTSTIKFDYFAYAMNRLAALKSSKLSPMINASV